MTRPKVRIDQGTLSFAELADIEEATHMSLSELFEKSQARGMAALVWITMRRNDPTFTYDQALQYGPSDIENVDADPEVSSVSDGATQPLSVVSGESAQAT